MNRLARIAIVQDDCILGETARNIEKASGLIKRAAEQDAGLVVIRQIIGKSTHGLADFIFP